MENLPTIVFTKNSDFILTYINPAGEKLLDKKLEDIVGKDDFEIFPAELAKELRKNDQEVLSLNKIHKSYEEINLKDKKIILENQKIPLVDENGNQFILGISQDITEFKQKESELYASLSFVESLIESSQDGLLVVDHISRKVVKVNSAFLNLWNIPQDLRDSKDDEKLLGFAISQLSDPKQFISLVEDLYRRPKDISSDEIEFKDGRIFTRTSFPQLMDGKPVARIWNFRDITQQKVKEKELDLQRSLNVHQSKMASIGELAAGVGHEINNPLAIVNGYISNLYKKLLNGDTISQSNLIDRFEKIQKANQRIADILNGLRSFSYSKQNDSKPFNALDAVNGTFGLVSEIYKKDGINIQLTEDSFNPSISMKGDQGKLQQILMNLIANAKDAIEIRKEKNILINIYHDEEHINIKVKDNGVGIPKFVQKDIFNPFFTTKEINKGTGIGLSLVANFVKEMNGSIDFDTSKAGTTFHLRFPICEDQELNETNECHVNNIFIEKHKKRVLIVEDEESIREIFEDILEDLGYETVSAINGLEGYEMIKENTDQFDLVISDIKMPKMTGYELIAAIEKLELSNVPKFIFSTGGVDEDLEKKLQSFSNVVGFFYKPFTIEDIEKILSRI